MDIISISVSIISNNKHGCSQILFFKRAKTYSLSKKFQNKVKNTQQQPPPLLQYSPDDFVHKKCTFPRRADLVLFCVYLQQDFELFVKSKFNHCFALSLSLQYTSLDTMHSHIHILSHTHYTQISEAEHSTHSTIHIISFL